MSGRSAPARALQARSGKDPPQGLAADLYPFALGQQLGQVGVVGVRVAVPGQRDDLGGDFGRYRIARPAAAVAVV